MDDADSLVPLEAKIQLTDSQMLLGCAWEHAWRVCTQQFDLVVQACSEWFGGGGQRAQKREGCE
jgi:hypothetical protein